MAIRQLVDFSDIIEAIREELGIQSTDTVKINRIRRDINLIYLDEVLPAHRWKWLEGETVIKVPATYAGGTVSVTQNSATATLSSTPDVSVGSFVGYNFSPDGDAEVYEIIAHDIGSDTLTLNPSYNGSTNATKSFKIWREKFSLPVDCRETVEVSHDFHRDPMEGRGLQEFHKIKRRGQKVEGRPMWYYTGSFEGTTEDDRQRQLQVFPSVFTSATNLKIHYVKEVAALEVDGDEPVIPLEDRIILVYGALARMWMKERNPEAAAYNQSLYDRKISRMLGKPEDTLDKPQFRPDSIYVSSKRGPRAGRFSSSKLILSGAEGGGASEVKFLTGVTIQGATITADVTVNAGVLIDGRDISVDGANLDAHIAALSGAHASSAISYNNADSSLTSVNVKDALDELDAAIGSGGTALQDHIDETTGAHAGSAISYDNAVSGLTAVDVQAAIDENAQSISDVASDLSDHETETTGAHAATAISYDNTTSALTATEVQAAIDEVEGRLDTAESDITTNAQDISDVAGDLSDHETETTGAHAATAISYNNATSGLAAADVQAAIDEVEARVDTSLQTSGVLQASLAVDSTTTGASQTLGTPTSGIVQVSDAGLTSITGVSAPSVNQFFILTNTTGDSVDVLNEAGTAANQIVTGTGLDLTLADGASLWLYYDLTGTKWYVVGGSGGSSRVATGTSSAPTEISSTGITALQGADEDIYVDTASGEVDVTANPQISAGTVDGQTMRIIGTSDADYIKLEDGDGLRLNGPWLSYESSVLSLRWDAAGTRWQEVSRSE
jgi:hypothetical protein